MSANGNGDGPRARFNRFHERIGKPDFLPDFLGSLVAVMADPTRDIEEQVLAWAKYRAWGNQNEYAIHIYARNGGQAVETPLGQQECGCELGWLQAGFPVEWLDAPLGMLEKEMERLGIKAVATKSHVSRAFQFNERGGTIASNTGRKIEPVVSPSVQNQTPKVACVGEFREFREWRKVARVREFQELEVARARVKELREVERADYNEWRRLRAEGTPGTPPIIPITSITEEASAAAFPSLPPENATATATALESPPDPQKAAAASPPTTQATEKPVPTYERFKSFYPRERLDDAKARAAFAQLSPLEKEFCIEGLMDHLMCPQWVGSKTEDNGAFIPLASNFITRAEYKADPPDYKGPKKTKRQDARSERERLADEIYRKEYVYDVDTGREREMTEDELRAYREKSRRKP